MKNLLESLFDDNLAEQSLDIENFYGLIVEARVLASTYMGVLDMRQIKRDFNKITKDFPPKDWSSNKYDSMKKISANENTEALRELTYIIAAGIKTSDILSGDKINDSELIKEISEIASKYIVGGPSKNRYINVGTIEGYKGDINVVNINIWSNIYRGSDETCPIVNNGRIAIYYRRTI